MAYLNVTGIVLRYVNYKDNDRILTLFTQERGRVDAKARGCRRPKSPLLSCAQPFVYGEFQLFAGKEHYTVNQCDIRETFYPLREDMDRLSCAYAMLALTQAAVQQEEPNRALFSSLYHSLSFLCYGENQPLDIALCFITRFLEANGLCPSITYCASCGKDLRGLETVAFSHKAGGALCPGCEAGMETIRVHGITLEAMRRMLRLPDTEIARVKMPPAVQKELHDVLTAYVEYVMDKPFAALKALRALTEAQ